jgi:hypothetical protein
MSKWSLIYHIFLILLAGVIIVIGDAFVRIVWFVFVLWQFSTFIYSVAEKKANERHNKEWADYLNRK